jgi:hypothetical protein
MSKNLKTAKSKNNADVNFTSFSGGVNRGRCLQVSQNWEDVVQMDRKQVEKAVAIMSKWLKETA